MSLPDQSVRATVTLVTCRSRAAFLLKAYRLRFPRNGSQGPIPGLRLTAQVATDLLLLDGANAPAAVMTATLTLMMVAPVMMMIVTTIRFFLIDQEYSLTSSAPYGP
jgi:hypothetical protein